MTFPPCLSSRTFPSILVLAPTRELSSQIYDEGRKFTYKTGLRAVVVYGGAEVREQKSNLERGFPKCFFLVSLIFSFHV